MARFRIDDILAESKPEVPIFLSESQLTDETSNLAHESPFGAQRRPPVDQRRLLIQSPSAYQQVETPLITATCRQPLSEEPKQQEVTKGENEMDKCDRKLCQTPESDNDNEERSPSNDAQNKKQRKPRTAFSDSQLQSLEKSFERQKYLSVQERMELAAKLQLADAQVKCWFQNRRTKWKRQNSMQFEAADLFPALRQMFPFSSFPVPGTHNFHRTHLPVFHPVDRPFSQFFRPY